MADILPSRPDVSDDDDKDPRVVGLDSDEVDELLAAIGSGTARTLLAELHDEPGTPSEVASRVDTSIQNAQYHLDRLETAGLIESAGTAYSEKGREMTVYAPADRALVVVAGKEEDTSGLQSVLTQVLGGLGVVALGSVIVDRLVRSGAAPTVSLGSSGAGEGGAGGADGGSAGGTDAATNESGTETATETATPGESETATPASEPTQEPTATSEDGGFQIAESADTPTPEPTAEPTAAPTSEPTATEAPTETAAKATQTAADVTKAAVETARAGGDGPVRSVAEALSALPPGAFFFVGGAIAVTFLAVAWQREWL
ncbi:helix-turn-helix domain-containing protein [Halobellus salinisoli]|uniref:helix-turn-helix domain-containing protein n=1 Tax=Halobellus salinisoli TaxID=3108500 RepID=UPI003009E7E7